ncbi:predicted protein [Coccidioides posadasii str. Silveira]|uniref:Predicted protein n=1 Tax=Coccidioides posadasii (strain RMSCC 757 / Silveira) TaxID=443226 RepID=E9DGA0_COCPS|nr:predicted protein [Coccidioides posadasii str. Silveira]
MSSHLIHPTGAMAMAMATMAAKIQSGQKLPRKSSASPSRLLSHAVLIRQIQKKLGPSLTCRSKVRIPVAQGTHAFVDAASPPCRPAPPSLIPIPYIRGKMRASTTSDNNSCPVDGCRRI